MGRHIAWLLPTEGQSDSLRLGPYSNVTLDDTLLGLFDRQVGKSVLAEQAFGAEVG